MTIRRINGTSAVNPARLERETPGTRRAPNDGWPNRPRPLVERVRVAGAVQEIVDAVRTAEPATCILTRTDVAISLGGALPVLIPGRPSRAYSTDRQRFPEDLQVMRHQRKWLAKKAVALMWRSSRVTDANTPARSVPEVTTHAYA